MSPFETRPKSQRVSSIAYPRRTRGFAGRLEQAGDLPLNLGDEGLSGTV